MPFCRECGNEIDGVMKFCPHCAAPQEVSPSTKQPSEATPMNAPTPIIQTPPTSNIWSPLFDRENVYCWVGKKGVTIIKAKIGRLIIAKEGIIFVSSGHANIMKDYEYFVDTPETVNLDDAFLQTDLRNPGSLKIHKSDITKIQVAGLWKGRYIRIYSRTNGDFSIMPQMGFSKSDLQILSQLTQSYVEPSTQSTSSSPPPAQIEDGIWQEKNGPSPWETIKEIWNHGGGFLITLFVGAVIIMIY